MNRRSFFRFLACAPAAALPLSAARSNFETWVPSAPHVIKKHRVFHPKIVIGYIAEGGSEGIVPLRRGPDGKLGIARLR